MSYLLGMHNEPTQEAVRAAFRGCGLRPEEIAVACDCNSASVYRWVRLGQLPRNRLVKAAFIRTLGLDQGVPNKKDGAAQEPAGVA
ncbi:MAG: hypothetical protein RLZZ127_655 [Planctomycetota bacterium]